MCLLCADEKAVTSFLWRKDKNFWYFLNGKFFVNVLNKKLKYGCPFLVQLGHTSATHIFKQNILNIFILVIKTKVPVFWNHSCFLLSHRQKIKSALNMGSLIKLKIGSPSGNSLLAQFGHARTPNLFKQKTSKHVFYYKCNKKIWFFETIDAFINPFYKKVKTRLNIGSPIKLRWDRSLKGNSLLA